MQTKEDVKAKLKKKIKLSIHLFTLNVFKRQDAKLCIQCMTFVCEVGTKEE